MERLIDLPDGSVSLTWHVQQGGTSPGLNRVGNAYEQIRFFNPVVTTGNAGMFRCRTLITDIPSVVVIFATGEGSVNIQSNATQ